MSLRRLIIRPGTALLSSFAASSALNYLFSLALGWLLIPGDFGLLAFAQSVLLIAGLILNSGFTWSLSASIVGLAGEERAALIRGSLAANLLAALAMGGLLLALFAAGPLRGGFEQPQIVAMVVAALPLISVVTVARAAAQGAERFGVVAALQLIEVLVKAAGGVAMAAMGFGAAGAIAGFTLGALVAAGLGLAVLARQLAVGLRGAVRWPNLRGARAMFGAVLGLSLLLNLDLAALKLLAGAERALVGYYQAGLVLANTPYFLMSALMPMLFTRASQAGSLAAARPHTGDALRKALVFLIPIELGMALAPEAVLGLLFPAGYGAGAELLRLLALGNCAVILALPLANALQATGQAQIVARALLGVAAVESLALWAVVPRWGGAGAAGAFLAAAWAALAALLLCHRAGSGAWGLWGRGWPARYAAALLAGGGAFAAALAAGLPALAAALVAGPLYLALVVSMRLVELPAGLRAAGPLRWAERSR